MYIHRIIIRDFRNFDNLDITLFDNDMQRPLNSVLLIGPNGSGKTTVLRVIAALWKNFAEWLRLDKSLNYSQQAQNGFIMYAGLVAIELRDFDAGYPHSIWLFTANAQKYRDELIQMADNPGANFIGEIRGGRGQPKFEREKETDWFTQLNLKKQKLQIGVEADIALPNLIFLEAQDRTIISPKESIPEPRSESFYRWLVTYEGRDRWDGHIETVLRNVKLRNPKLFKTIVDNINQFWGNDKKITDFDNNLRLQVQIGKRKTDTHSIDLLSSGEQQCLIMMVMVSRWLMPGGVVLIDEPDLHLHESLQRHFIHELERLIHKRQGQLIIASHSSEMRKEFYDSKPIDLGQLETV